MIKGNPYWVYLILSGASTFFNALMFTLQQVYYVQAVGMSPLQLVLAGTVMEIAAFLFEVPTGVVADTVSRRLSVIAGMFVTGLGFLIQGLIPRYPAVLAGSIIWGIGFTFLSGAREAWIAGEVGEERLSAVFLRTGQVRQVAVVAGIFAATGLSSLSLSLPIVAGSSLTMAFGLWLIWAMPERGFQPTPRGNRTTWQAMGVTLREGSRVVRQSPVLLTIMGVSAFGGAASEGLDRLREAHLLQNFHFPILDGLKPVVWFGIIQAGAQLLGFIAIQVGRSRLAQLSPRAVARVLLVANTFSVACVIVFALAGSFTLAVAALWGLAVAGAVSGPVYDAWLARNISPRVRATVLSMISQVNSAGQAAGGPIIGAVGTTFRLRAAMLVVALFEAPASVLYTLLMRRGRHIMRLPEADTAAIEEQAL